VVVVVDEVIIVVVVVRLLVCYPEIRVFGGKTFLRVGLCLDYSRRSEMRIETTT
jgi:hypothetical protein